MGRKKKGVLPSGSVRIQKKIGVRPDGTRIMKSFTGKDRDDAERRYRDWFLNKAPERQRVTITVSQAILKYIDAKKHVLSPSTLRSYYSVHKNHLTTGIGEVYLEDLTNRALQIWVSDLASTLSPKTVRNANALVQASVEMFAPDYQYKVTLPQKVPADLYCPSDQDIKRLLSEIKDKDPEMYRAVLLAAFGPMRRSEICALTSDDIRGNQITVNKALVYDEVGAPTLKTTKTVGSNRVIEYPDFVIKALEDVTGRIVLSSPDVLSNRFRRTVKRIGGPSFRFHDLRHYAASIMHAIGVPDQYIMARGGWSSDNVMKRVYRNVINVEEAKQTKKILGHFKKIAN
ncbi:MAG: site-specific integrase [Lachnospiraceae bacterium]|nr:site-specific integrase [Lachnospiraceae bacterium]